MSDNKIMHRGRWQKGQSGNPNGAPKLDPELKAIKSMSSHYVKRAIARLLRMDAQELKAFLLTSKEEGGPNNLELMVASIMQQAVIYGDHNKLSFLLDRAVGKVREEIGDEVRPVVYVTSVAPDGQLVQEVAEEMAGAWGAEEVGAEAEEEVKK